MTPISIFVLYQICQVVAVDKISNIIQDSGVKTAQAGENVTLRCSCRDDAVTFLSWYQQSLGGKPQIISSLMKHSNKVDVSPAYKERFQVFAQSQQGINELIITDLRLSDSATYYCGVLIFNSIEFGPGVFLHVKQSNIQAAAHQPKLEPLQPGRSVNLSCTVYSEACAGEQRLYWFRHHPSQPAVVYPSEGQCRNEEPHGKNCTLNLSIKSASSSDVGTYYCAVATCGEIVFGDGTKVEIIGSAKVASLLVYCLSVTLTVSIVVLLAFAFIMYKLRKKLCSVCGGTVSHQACSAASDALSHDADSVQYAALSLKRSGERRHQEDSVCVYSRVKSRKQ